VLAALIIVALSSLPGTLELFLRFPELLLVQAGCILLINKYLDFRLLEGVNPLVAWPWGAGTPGEPSLSICQIQANERESRQHTGSSSCG
jgi:hypothetical protein